MRIISLSLLLAAAAWAQSFTIEQVLSAPFPSDLKASPTGKLAWVSNARGVRNILVAEPPQYRARALTSYTADDGQEISQLRWTPDGRSIVYTRGGTLNPAHDPHGVEEAVWIAALDGGVPRKFGAGESPAVSPKG